jgi:hypothetical protein
VAGYSCVAGLEAVLSTNPDVAILCIVPAGFRDLNGVYAAVVVRVLMPTRRVLLVPGGAGDWVEQPLALAKARGYGFEVLPEPIHPKGLLQILKEMIGGDIEPMSSPPPLEGG